MSTEPHAHLPSAWVVGQRPLVAAQESWQRLAQAQHTGDHVALAAASAALARRCLDEHDLDEAQFHVQRASQVLTHAPGHSARLLLQCDLVALLLALSLAQRQEDADIARRLADDVRDAGYQIVRGSAAIDEVGARVAALLHVAECLEALGDHSDAQALRTQAFHGLGPSVGLAA